MNPHAERVRVRARIGELLIALLSSASSLTCATSGHAQSPEVTPAGAVQPAAPVAESPAPLAALEPAASTSGGEADAELEEKARGYDLTPLTRFYAALSRLERGERLDHVRVLWLGDSHSAADFLPNAVRTSLGRRFGRGGPGFVHLGVQSCRSSGVPVEMIGRWRTEPAGPTALEQLTDRVLGLGGMRSTARAPAKLYARLAPTALRGSRARWQLLYRLPRGARLRARFGTGTYFELKSNRARASIQQHQREVPASDQLELQVLAGKPQLFGAVVEGNEPGVVIDTVGMNGARVATPLAWDEQTFIAQVRARSPELVVLAYGTNELFDARSPAAYARHYGSVLERVRSAAPGADCLFLGPPDAADVTLATPQRLLEIDAVVRAAAEQLGCGYFSLMAAMGGQNSFATWMNREPPLASTDRIHLKPGGYVQLGDTLAARLLEAYSLAQVE